MATEPHVLHVVGARPNFPKLTPVLKALNEYPVRQTLVHTGQHYDAILSQVFLDQFGLREPDHFLGIGSGSHGEQTARAIIELEKLFLTDRPDLVVVYGDINSTLAAAISAAKLQIPLAHVEAGLRSFDRTMPEEINRLLVDQLADLLLVTSPDAIGHLSREGADQGKIHFVGNPMIDTLLRFRDNTTADLDDLGLPATYGVATIHRPGNVDDDTQVSTIVSAFHEAADEIDLFIPLHPRGRENLTKAGLFEHGRIHALDPLGYIEFISVVRGAELVITDSGGIQEETTILGVPCLTLRPNTERPITITHGTNLLVTPETLGDAVRTALAAGKPTSWPTPPLWDGQAGPRIAQVISDFLSAAGKGLPAGE